MTEALGWIGTAAVLAGYALNSQQKYVYAMLVWIAGDALWIAYDIAIANAPHCILSACIIGLNIRGIVRITKQRRNADKSYLDV